MPLLIPQLLWADGGFHQGRAVRWDEGTGRILAVGSAAELAADAPGDVAEHLTGAALLPGFVNAHSHAFQRLIRGHTQWRPAGGTTGDFWSWRSAMYDTVLRLSPEDIEAVSRLCFLEMLRAGFTAVGEFHYLHRDPAGNAYADQNELAHRVIAAARQVGIRIVLLDACYARGGIDRPLEPEQRRFATPTLESYLTGVAALTARYRDEPLVSVGVAPHSIRAVPREWLGALARWADTHAAPVHMHVSEQPAEVDASRAAWGLAPVAVLADEGVLGPDFTAVHATHCGAGEIAALRSSGATVCACPTTEADLGDGFLPVQELAGAGVPIALGTDSQTRIDPFEEMRLVEYHERLRRQHRVMVATPAAGEPDRLDVGSALLPMATSAGARSLRIGAGRLAAGEPADLVAIDLEHPMLAGWTAGTLPSLLGLCAAADVVRDVWVDGRRRIRAGHHEGEEAVLAAYRPVARLLEG